MIAAPRPFGLPDLDRIQAGFTGGALFLVSAARTSSRRMEDRTRVMVSTAALRRLSPTACKADSSPIVSDRVSPLALALCFTVLEGGAQDVLRNRFARLSFLTCCIFLTVTGTLPAQPSASSNPTEAHRRAEALLKQMTIDEKVGQMNQSAGIALPGFVSGKPDNLIVQGKVGLVLWLIDVKEINRLQHLAVEKSRLHIPILFGYDVIHGYRTVFPVPLAMASSWDPAVEESCPAPGGPGRTRSRHSVDIYSHGRHCPRRALGTHR